MRCGSVMSIRPDGFTLLEVLASVAILGIAYITLGSSGIQGLQHEGEARRRLEACPPALRGFEWQHLSLAIDGSLATLRGHQSAVTAVAMNSHTRCHTLIVFNCSAVCFHSFNRRLT